MSEIFETWSEAQLESVLISLESGSRPKGGVSGIHEGLPSIGAEHISETRGFKFGKIKYIPYTFFEKLNRGVIKKGDILIVKDGATTGKVALVSEGFPFDKAAVNEHVFICRVHPLINSNYLHYFLWSQEGKNRILNNFRGSAQGGINTQFVSNTLVPLAPFEEQKRIANKLDGIFEKLDKNKKRLDKIPEIIEGIREGVLEESTTSSDLLTVVDFAKYVNLLKDLKSQRIQICTSKKEKETISEEYDELIKQAKKNKIIEIRTELICHLITKGTTPKKFHYNEHADNIPYLKVYNIVNNKIDFEYKPQYVDRETHDNFLKRSKVYPNDILMNIVGPPLCKVAIIPETFEEWNINQALAIFRPLGGIDTKYLFHFLASGKEIKSFEMNKRGTAGQSNISLAQCRDLKLKLYPLEIQKQISKKIDALLNLADQIEIKYNNTMQTLDELPHSILLKAFRGDLVEHDPNDEPAKKLLERILAEKDKLKKSKKK
jgi:type I restriction enzyme S subunit